MQYKDLENFTWEELSYFKWEDLMLGKLELLKQAKQDSEVPPEIVEKVRTLCSDLAKSIGDSSICPPADKKKFTIKTFNDFSTAIFNAIRFYNLLPPEIRQEFMIKLTSVVDTVLDIL